MKIPKANIGQLTALARVAFASNRFLAIYGKGGIGKTTIPKTLIAPALGFDETWVVNLSGASPQEATGYLVPDSVTRDGWFSSPEGWPTVARVGAKHVLLVLDEYPEWDLSVQSLCRSLFNPHGSAMIGVHELGENVRIIITGNRRSDGSRSAVPSAPFVERCLSVCVEPTLDGWLEWAATEGLASSPVYAFLKFQGGDQHGVDHFNPDVPTPWDGSPHPCPRAWEAACRASLEDIPSGLLPLVLEGFVGESAGRAAYAFSELVVRLLPLLSGIRAGGTVPTDAAEQHAIAHAAIRVAKRETSADPAVAVASGALDWLVRLLAQCRGEIRAYGFDTAVRCGLPLDQHPRRAELQGI